MKENLHGAGLLENTTFIVNTEYTCTYNECLLMMLTSITVKDNNKDTCQNKVQNNNVSTLVSTSP